MSWLLPGKDRATPATAATYSEDGVRVGAVGDIQHGRAEIKAAYDKLLGGRFKGGTVSLGAQSVRILGDGYAIWPAPMEIQTAGGAAPVKGYALDVMRKAGGRWLTLEATPSFSRPCRRNRRKARRRRRAPASFTSRLQL